MRGDVFVENFATEMLKEQKTNNKRMFFALIVTMILWFSSIGLFVWYINQYEYIDTTEVSSTASDVENTNINQEVGK